MHQKNSGHELNDLEKAMNANEGDSKSRNQKMAIGLAVAVVVVVSIVVYMQRKFIFEGVIKTPIAGLLNIEECDHRSLAQMSTLLMVLSEELSTVPTCDLTPEGALSMMLPLRSMQDQCVTDYREKYTMSEDKPVYLKGLIAEAKDCNQTCTCAYYSEIVNKIAEIDANFTVPSELSSLSQKAKNETKEQKIACAAVAAPLCQSNLKNELSDMVSQF